MNIETAKNINILGDFCGRRDVEELSKEKLSEKYNIREANTLYA